MKTLEKHIININAKLTEALKKINDLPDSLTLFVEENGKIIGSLTDGDIRRGLINGFNVDDNLINFVNTDFYYLKDGNFDINKIKEIRTKRIKAVPVLNKNGELINIYNFSKIKSLLPIDAVIMAGGEGKRLRPLTLDTPKPLLPVGNKAILDYNLERLQYFGISNIYITVKYLSEKIKQHIDSKDYEATIKLIYEEKPLGTFGAVSLINNFKKNYILVMNSDLLTNIDYEDFFKSFVEKQADMMIASVAYEVNLPYAILESDESREVKSFKEKPSYTYFANGGIYLIKKELLSLIPNNTFFDATDFMNTILDKGFKLMHYPIRSYWLDIGKHGDYERAQRDISHISWE